MKLKVLIITAIFALVAVNANSQTAEEWFQQGKTAFESNDYQKTIECFEQVIKLEPDFAEAYNTMAEAYLEMGFIYEIGDIEYEKAIECYEKAVKYNPDFVGAYLRMAAIYENWVRQYAKAIECYEKALKYEPDDAQAYLKMGNAYYNWNDQYAKAIECWQQAIKYKPDFAAAYFIMAGVYLTLGNEDKAIANVKKAAQLGSEEAKQWLKDSGIE